MIIGVCDTSGDDKRYSIVENYFLSGEYYLIFHFTVTFSYCISACKSVFHQVL